MKQIIILFTALLIYAVGLDAKTSGPWMITKTIDEMTDKLTIVYTTKIKGNLSIVIYDENGDNTADSIKFVFGKKYLNNGEFCDFSYRIDGEEPVETQAWCDGPSALIEGMTNAIIRDMLYGKKMVVRVRAYNGNEYTESFNLESYKSGIKVLSGDAE